MAEEKLSTRDIAGRPAAAGEFAGEDPAVAADESRRGAGDPRVVAENVPHDTDTSTSPLFADEESRGYRTRWDAVQTGFVDEPRHAVEEADNLVADVMKRLAEAFADERGAMERQWAKGAEVSTEDLRQALRRYRTFFQRLLDV